MRSMMTGNHTSTRTTAPPVALRCTGLVKRYPDVTAVDGIDLEVRMGECFGLLGPNGAGKTTTVEIFEGLTKPDGGTVEVLGSRWGAGHDRALRNRFGVQLQETLLSEKLTVAETIQLFHSFYTQGRDVDSIIRLVELDEKRDARVGKLSGGQKQRLAIACALTGDPDLLFLDEPTTGLDPQSRHAMWDLLQELNAKGQTIFLTTHYMEEADQLCQRIAIMDKGKFLALDAPAPLKRSVPGGYLIELTVHAADNDGQALVNSLRNLPGVAEVNQTDGLIRLYADKIEGLLANAMRAASEHSVSVTDAHVSEPSLENLFLHLTGRSLRS